MLRLSAGGSNHKSERQNNLVCQLCDRVAEIRAGLPPVLSNLLFKVREPEQASAVSASPFQVNHRFPRSSVRRNLCVWTTA
jgi:hypothetical protein